MVDLKQKKPISGGSRKQKKTTKTSLKELLLHNFIILIFLINRCIISYS